MRIYTYNIHSIFGKTPSITMIRRKIVQSWRNLSVHSRSIITDAATVKLKHGTLRGGFESNFYFFKGIPYAQPPVGNLRFQPPEPLSTFEQSPLDCTEHRNQPPQKDFFSSKYVGSEDCLHLNVYSPNLNKKCPVMFFIYGGAFSNGNGDCTMYSPEPLIANDVVVVTINYRLGPLGFLCNPKLGIYGNMGLKDQQLALKWVSENIAAFGGDPGNVTLFGESAGGSCVHLHLLNPESRKYFHKAICMSGNGIMDWVYQVEPYEKAVKMAELLGAKNETEHLNTLMKADPFDLTKYSKNTLHKDERRRGLPIHFKPVIEVPNETAFITENPITLLMENSDGFGNIPTISGLTDMEGIFMLKDPMYKPDKYKDDVCRWLPLSLNIVSDTPMSLTVGRQIRDFYFGNEPNEKNINDGMVDFHTDIFFAAPHYQNAELLARFHHGSDHFLYRFGYVGELNTFKKFFGPEYAGACHIDDLCYLFRMRAFDPEVPSAEADFRRLFTRLWTNFAKYGNPTPDSKINFKWLPIDKVDPKAKDVSLNCLDLNKDTKMVVDPDKARIDFWRNIYKTCNESFLRPKL